MCRKFLAVGVFCVLFFYLLLLTRITPTILGTKPPEQTPRENPKTAKTVNYGFPSLDSCLKPPEWWKKLNKKDPRKYPIFELSQDYPAEAPSPRCPDEECRWQKLDFRTQSKEYLFEVLKYAFEGNLEIDWRVQENPVRKWYHAPWMHTSKYGREFIHGLTKERHLCKAELLAETKVPCPDKERTIESWAVGIYNERGAYYIGKVWEEMLKDKPNAANFPAEGFPEGTVSFKLLFTEGGKEHDAHFLDNSFEWRIDNKRANINDLKADECILPEGINPKCIGVVRLLQIDVAVRDNRSPTGWVFGTFVYNAKAPAFYDYKFSPTLTAAEKENLRRWLKLEFVGLMYGNDEKVKLGGKLTESIINREIKVPQKLGCGGRLNGLVDTPVSSCMSCHALAETEANLKLDKMPYDQIAAGCNDEKLSVWFRNINPRSEDLIVKTFTKPEQGRRIVSLDYSLQLREGIMRFCEQNKSKCGLSEKNPAKVFTVTRSGIEDSDESP
jgi:hypothetical protein